MAAQRGRRMKTLPRSSDPGSSAFRIDRYPFYRMACIGALYAACLEQALKPRGLDQPRWRVLMILHEHNPAAAGLIARRAVMKLPTAVKLIQRMASQGLVRTAPLASDQRVSQVAITAQGRRALKVVRQVASGVYRAAVADFSSQDIADFLDLLSRAEANLERIHGAGRRSPARRGSGRRSAAG